MPEISIVKLTNGLDSNDPNGPDVPVIAPGDTVTWTYEVTNTGLVDINAEDITVTDSVIGDVTTIIDQGDGDGVLAPGETWTYQATGDAINLVNPPNDPNLELVDDVCNDVDGSVPGSTAYTNLGTVTIPDATDSDPATYCGPEPSIEIVKFTNGQDSNDPNGSDVPVIAPGDTVTWTYVVTNTGSIDINAEDITVTDSVIGDVTTIIDQSDGDGVFSSERVVDLSSDR